MDNPFRINATDETEVKCARIRETEETKRVKLCEAEKTKRTKIQEREQTKQKNIAREMPIQAINGISVFLISIVVGVAGYNAYSDYIKSRSIAPIACVDTILRTTLATTCDRSDQKLETLVQNGDTLLVCRCTHETPVPAPSHS